MASFSGRPRDKGGKSAPGKEIEMSNSTLSHFFGGKQRAWMTGSCSTKNLPDAPYKPLKTPSQGSNPRKLLRHTEAAVSHQAIPSQADIIQQMSPASNPRTNQASATRGNVETQVVLISKDHSTRMDPMLPSPAPSEEILQENDSSITNDDGKGLSPLQRSADLELFETFVRRDAVAGTKVAPTIESQMDAQEVPPGVVAGKVPLNHMKRSQGSEELPNPKRRMTSEVEYSTDRQPLPEQAGRREIVPKVTMSRNNSQPSDPPLKSYLTAIDSRFEIIGNRDTLEGRRLRLLREACECGDPFYLAIHQLFCMSSAPLSIHSLAGLTNQLIQGMVVLNQILLSNDGLSMDAIQWFSNFPSPLETLLQTSFRFQMAYECARECIAVLHRNWQRYQSHCFARLIPPLVDEMERELCVRSPVMQRVIHLAIHRGFWIGEDDTCSRLSFSIFNASQEKYKTWRSRFGTASQPTNEELTRYREALINDFRHLRTNHHERHLQPGMRTNGQRTPTYQPQMTFPTEHPQGSQTPQARATGSQTPWAPNPGTATFNPTMVLPSQHGSGAPPLETAVSGHQHPHLERGGDTSMTLNMPFHQRNVSTSNLSRVNAQMSQRYQAMESVGRPQAYTNPPTPVHTNPENHLSSTVRPVSRTHSMPIPSAITTIPMNNVPSTNRSMGRPPSSNLVYGNTSSRSINNLQAGPPGMATSPGMAATARPFRQRQRLTLTQPRRGSPRPVTSQAGMPARSPRARLRLSQPMPPGSSTLLTTSLNNPLVVMNGAAGNSEVANVHYQYVKDFAIEPFTMGSETRNTLKHFTISPETWAIIPKHVRQANGQLIRQVVPGSLQYSLRCVKISSVEGMSESNWVIEETTWPDFTVVAMLNAESLDIGRKNKDGKSFPVDVTSVLKEGPNTLHLSTIGPAVEAVNSYAIAMEIIEVNDQMSLQEAVGSLSAAEMKQHLLLQLGNNDPDIEVVNGNIAIGLTDPFSSCLINKPVRGKACKHYDCFDLSTFLQTREGPVCRPEQFRCPICGADARPQTLIVDQWTLSVLTEVKSMRRFDAKAIVVDDNADWVIKEGEADGDVRNHLSGGTPHGAAGCAGRRSVIREPEVIELD